jgi:OFA family oxalate/formate antiporter-like MFS transporter
MSKRIVPLIAGSFIYLSIGLIYAWSIFVKPLEAEFGWNRTETSLTFTISMISFCIGGVISGILLKKKSGRFIIMIAAALLAVGFMLSSRVETLSGIYISYGVFCGLGVGLAYNANISTVIRWFPDKVGLVSGILLMCFGGGGLILGSIASSLIVSMGFRTTFVLLALTFAVILFIGGIFIKPPGENDVLPEKKIKSNGSESFGTEISTMDMLKRKSFWLYFSWSAVLTGAGLAVIGHAAVAAQDIGATVAQAALIMGIVSIFNGIGRVLVGLIFDRFGRKVSIIWSNSIMVMAFVLLLVAVATLNITFFIAGGVVIGLAYGSIPPTNAAYVNLFYGTKNYALNFSVMNTAIIPGSILGPLLAGAIKTATGSYFIAFAIILGLAAVAYLLQLVIKRP